MRCLCALSQCVADEINSSPAKSQPQVCKSPNLNIVIRNLYRRPRLNSARKVVYIGGIAYNASSKKLSRRLSSNSSKKAFGRRSARSQGNKVWLAKHQAVNFTKEDSAHPGYEIRPKGGNRQWIAGDKSALVRKANSIKHKYISRGTTPRRLSSSSYKSRGVKSYRVFIKDEEFVMNSKKNVLRKLSKTSLG